MHKVHALRRRYSNSSRSTNKISENGYKLFISEQAQQGIDTAGSYDRMRINQKIQSLAAMPRPEDAGKRIGSTDAYRIAVGHYRLDYVIYSGEVTITEASLDQRDAEHSKHEKPGLYHMESDGDRFRRRRVPKLVTNHAAVNGMQNDLDAAQELMAGHVQYAFGSNVKEFTLYHNPSVGFLGDLWESTRDKLSMTTSVAKQLAAILDDAQQEKKGVKWVVHSQGGAIFVQAVNYHNKTKGTPLASHSVQFHAGANNAMVSKGILAKAGIAKVGPDNNHPYDLVPNIAGMNTINPVKIVGSLLAAPALSDSGPLKHLKSPHTLPNTRENWKFWQWKD
jgi:mRNA-degrading endonuclease RelE of RelBE toxin-antitoxin system